MSDLNKMIMSSLEHPSTYIVGGGTAGAGIGYLYGSNEATSKYLTPEERSKKELANILLGSIYGTGLGATTYALKKFIEERTS